ncbi:hypothetical protein NSB25_05515 [Acetatifactor muris]|jgi:hypothetical protein|uniref:Uncharacterized protein n=1 Tax=Acetatifactor muris TaxID=879566 RepID=A0A2K4ZCY9_9FIRM|nr:hypothetical protein [Acetatifactor muris]MCI8798418.1 hypothetical protein [Lachnospiraceae bacterium]MCR2046737.1 hypothetical protein [Acetatifactor muris]SOY28329.1 hypothetical protein AMURIS_01036 [Acetatifactor muris]
MDFYGMNGYYGGLPFTDLPLGLGMGLTANEAALNGYAGLTEAQKEKVILRCKDARTKGEMQHIVDSLVPGTDVQEIVEEEKDSFS